MSDAAGDALYPVLGGSNVPGMDLLGTRLSLSGSTLKVIDTVVDLSNPTATAQALNALFLQYVTRWQMGNTIYYAAFSTTTAGQQLFYAGTAQSVDLCSVSACDPHIVVYPEVGQNAHSESGTVTCPASPSASSPCTVEIDVNVADVGSPGGVSAATTGVSRAAVSAPALEEIGTYAFASLVPQAAINNLTGQIDNVPLEVDGLCCFNASGATLTSSSGGSGNGGGGGNAGAAGLPNTTSSTAAASAAGLAAVAGFAALSLARRRRARR